MKPQFPTVQEQIDHWNTKERLEHERVMNIRAESPNERNETREDNRKIITSPIFPPVGVRGLDWCAVFDGYEPGCPIGHGATEQEAIEDLRDASNLNTVASDTALTLDQTEATTDWFDGLADTPYHLRDEGSVDGEGLSYSARNL